MSKMGNNDSHEASNQVTDELKNEKISSKKCCTCFVNRESEELCSCGEGEKVDRNNDREALEVKDSCTQLDNKAVYQNIKEGEDWDNLSKRVTESNKDTNAEEDGEITLADDDEIYENFADIITKSIVDNQVTTDEIDNIYTNNDENIYSDVAPMFDDSGDGVKQDSYMCVIANPSNTTQPENYADVSSTQEKVQLDPAAVRDNSMLLDMENNRNDTMSEIELNIKKMMQCDNATEAIITCDDKNTNSHPSRPEHIETDDTDINYIDDDITPTYVRSFTEAMEALSERTCVTPDVLSESSSHITLTREIPTVNDMVCKTPEYSDTSSDNESLIITNNIIVTKSSPFSYLLESEHFITPTNGSSLDVSERQDGGSTDSVFADDEYDSTCDVTTCKHYRSLDHDTTVVLTCRFMDNSGDKSSSEELCQDLAASDDRNMDGVSDEMSDDAYGVGHFRSARRQMHDIHQHLHNLRIQLSAIDERDIVDNDWEYSDSSLHDMKPSTTD